MAIFLGLLVACFFLPETEPSSDSGKDQTDSAGSQTEQKLGGEDINGKIAEGPIEYNGFNIKSSVPFTVDNSGTINLPGNDVDFKISGDVNSVSINSPECNLQMTRSPDSKSKLDGNQLANIKLGDSSDTEKCSQFFNTNFQPEPFDLRDVFKEKFGKPGWNTNGQPNSEKVKSEMKVSPIQEKPVSETKMEIEKKTPNQAMPHDPLLKMQMPLKDHLKLPQQPMVVQKQKQLPKSKISRPLDLANKDRSDSPKKQRKNSQENGGKKSSDGWGFKKVTGMFNRMSQAITGKGTSKEKGSGWSIGKFFTQKRSN